MHRNQSEQCKQFLSAPDYFQPLDSLASRVYAEYVITEIQHMETGLFA